MNDYGEALKKQILQSIDITSKVIQDTADSLTELFEKVKFFIFPRPFRACKGCVGRSGGGPSGRKCGCS